METSYTTPTAATPTTDPMASPTESIVAATAQAISPALASLIADNHYVERIAEHGPYGYEPILFLPIVFAALYAASALVHMGQLAWTRHWWLLLLVFACVAEAGGNSVRVYGHFKPRDVNPYMAQQIILVITPAFVAAMHYAILGRIIELFGSQFTIAHFKPRAITPIFVTLDLASLGIQGAGSGMAAVAEINEKDATGGGNIVVIGLCIQLAAYLCFNFLLITFFVKASASPNTHKNIWWTTKFKWFLAGLFLSSILVFCRSAFRTVEMIFGWIGPVSTVEWYFYAFDCAPVLAAVVLLNIFHPGYVLPSNHKEAVIEARKRRAASGEKRPRPRSSFYGGGDSGDLYDNSAELKDVTLYASASNPYGGQPRTQAHFRTASLASATSGLNTVTEKQHHAPDYENHYGWSAPGPYAAASASSRHKWVREEDVHRDMQADGFEPVPSPVYHDVKGAGSGLQVASGSQLSPSLYSYGGNKSMGSFISDEYGYANSIPPSPLTPTAPGVHVWNDDGDSMVHSQNDMSWNDDTIHHGEAMGYPSHSGARDNRQSRGDDFGFAM